MNCPVILLPISAYSVSEAIVNLTRQKKYGLVVLGGSNENLLQQVVKGNIPEAIAKNANSTVIIFEVMSNKVIEITVIFFLID